MSWELPPASLWLAAVTPVVSVVGCTAWSCLVWHFFPTSALDSPHLRAWWVFWGHDLPFDLFAGATAVTWLILTAFFILRRHGWLSVLLTLYYVPAIVLIYLGSMACVRVKLFG